MEIIHEVSFPICLIIIIIITIFIFHVINVMCPYRDKHKTWNIFQKMEHPHLIECWLLQVAYSQWFENQPRLEE